MPPLETVTLEGVEILAVGGPVHGVGSPPEGDYWTEEQLRGMAAAAQELEAAGEWRVPAKVGGEPLGRNKIGHDRKQRLASTAAAGEMPAVGWLTNQRVSDDGKKLLTDLADVPRKLADLIKAKAYRTRSSELSSVTSQTSGKKHEWVVSGLSWLGGKMPAVRTLDDVVAMYEGDEAERLFVQYDDEPTADAEELRDEVAGLGVELAAAYADEVTGRKPAPPDSRPMPGKTKEKYTDEQRRTFAETTGLAVEKVTDEVLDKAAETLKVEPAKPDETRELEADERIKTLEEKLEKSDERTRSLEDELAGERKRVFVEGLFRSGKAEPGQRAEIEKMYEASPDTAVKFFESVKPNDDLSREYGSDEDGDGDEPTPEEEEKRDLAERERIAREYDIPLEEVA